LEIAQVGEMLLPLRGACVFFGEPRGVGVRVEQLVRKGDERIHVLRCGFGRRTW
jgi:hypothetical protein